MLPFDKIIGVPFPAWCPSSLRGFIFIGDVQVQGIHHRYIVVLEIQHQDYVRTNLTESRFQETRIATDVKTTSLILFAILEAHSGGVFSFFGNIFLVDTSA